MLRTLIFAGFLAMAPLAAVAQADPAPTPDIGPKKPTPEQIVSARAEADRIIADAGAGDLFTNVTSDNIPRVRHTASGLVCRFEPGDARAKITIFEHPSIGRGDSVGCHGWTLHVLTTVYATKYPQPMSAEAAMQEAVSAIRHVSPDATPWEGPVTSIASPERDKHLPPRLFAAFRIKPKGGESYTSVAVAEHNGWIFKQRLTVPVAEAGAGQLFGAMQWLFLISDAAGRPL